MSIDSDVLDVILEKYGTSEGARLGWDKRGRGRKQFDEISDMTLPYNASPVIIPTESRQGKCYELTGQFVMANPDWDLVHATLFPKLGQFANKPYFHAFAVKGNEVYDTVFDKFFDKKKYYAYYSLTDEHRYDNKTAMKRMFSTQHYGPWDECDFDVIRKYGTSEGVTRSWDTRGRGQKEEPPKLDKSKLIFDTGGDGVGRGYHGFIAAYNPDTLKRVGYVNYGYEDGETYIKMIEVEPEFRRQGIGTLLLNRLKSDIAEGKELQVAGNFATKEGQGLLRSMKIKIEKYGTSEGVTRSWDTRGRGQKPYEPHPREKALEAEAEKRGLSAPESTLTFDKMSTEQFHNHILKSAQQTFARPEVQEAIKNTEGAVVTPEGLELDVVRYQKPEQAGGRAVRNGIFYLPEKKSPYAKYYHSKSNPYYGGAERFEGRTVYRNPLIVKGATGGSVPKQAYNFLLGDQSYEEMRDYINNKLYSPYVPRIDLKTKVENILEKYGGNKNFAYDIVDASKEGNQLQMAIIEHIIGAQARDDGHDAIIGYTKHKGTLRLSEVFDLREEEYPWQPKWEKKYEDYYDEFHQGLKEKTTKEKKPAFDDFMRTAFSDDENEAGDLIFESFGTINHIEKAQPTQEDSHVDAIIDNISIAYQKKKKKKGDENCLP